jgi:Origin of replication binding protein
MFDTAATEFHPLRSRPEDFAPGEYERLDREFEAKKQARQAAEAAAYKLKREQEAFKPTQPATRPKSKLGEADHMYELNVRSENWDNDDMPALQMLYDMGIRHEQKFEEERLRGVHDNQPYQTYETLGLSEEDFTAAVSIKRANVAAANPMRDFSPVNGVSGVPQLRRLLPDYQIAAAWDTAEGLAALGAALHSNRTVAITGAMGTGKTKAVLALTAKNSVLYIVPSRALGEQLVKRIPDSIYATEVAGISAEGPVGKDGKLYRSVVACTPSLHRIAGATFDVVVVDEAMGTLRQLHMSELCAAKRPQLTGALDGALRKASKIIVMDANLTPNAIWLLGGGPGSHVNCHTTFEPMPCTVSMIQGTKIAAMGALIKSAQETGEKIVCHVDSTLTADSLAKLCRNNNIVSIVVSADHKNDREQYYFLTDTPTFWAVRPDVQVVIATNVLSCGYSIEGAGAAPIGQVWGIFQGANGQTPDDYAQSLFRVRSTAPRFVWVAKGCSGYASMYKQDTTGYPAFASFTNRMRKEQAKMRDFLMTYLVTQGCTLELQSISAAELDLTDVGTAAQKQARVDRLKSASVITVFEYEEMKNARYLHSTQKRAMARFEWVQRFGSDLTEAQWALAASGAFREKTALAHYLIDLELAQAAACPDADFHQPHISSAATWVVGGLTSHPLMMAYMGPVFGLLKGEHEDASGEGEVWAAFNEGAADIASNFRLTAKSNQDLLGKLLAMVGIKRSRKKRSDQSWAYSLDTDHWTVWKSFVQAGNAVVEGVRETVKKIQAACATSRAALGMVAYEVVNKLVAMVLPERTAEVVEDAEEEPWSGEVEAYRTQWVADFKARQVAEDAPQTQEEFEATFDPDVFFADRPQIHQTKDGRWWKFGWATGGFWTPKWLGRSAFYPLDADGLKAALKTAKKSKNAFDRVCCIPIPQMLQIPYVVNRERWYETPV